MPKFQGSVREWLPFWSQFKRVHEDPSISREEKFQRLIDATIQGTRANDIVRSYPHTAENYDKVVKSLKSRFGREDLLVECYVRELLGLVLQNAVKGGKKVNSLSTLYDKLETYINALESLGVTTDKCAAMLYPLVESALPEDTLRVWQRNVAQRATADEEQNNTKDRLKRLISFLQNEVEEEERIELALKGFGIPDQESKKKIPSPTGKNAERSTDTYNIPSCSALVNASEKKSVSLDQKVICDSITIIEKSDWVERVKNKYGVTLSDVDSTSWTVMGQLPPGGYKRKNTTENKARLNKATKELKKTLREDKNLKIENYLRNLSPTETSDYSLWKATKFLKRPQPFIPPIKSGNEWARSDEKKAAVFADHLSGVFVAPPRLISEIEEENLLQGTMAPANEGQLRSATLHEIKTLIEDLKNKKTPGYDGISSKTLKELPLKAVRFITILVNSCLRLKFFPSQWKVAQIILVGKPGKPTELVTSYRPISLLPICAKMYEKIILSRLKPLLFEEHIIPEHQFGFRECHSTIEQVNRIVVKIRSAFERKQYCSAVFLDVAQAFDKVWHTSLLHKIRLKFPENIYLLLKSYLENRTFQVKFNNIITKLYNINAGVPQGSVLGPTLYLIYTSDIPLANDVTTATYADDTSLLSSPSDPTIASINLQGHLTAVQNWFRNWRIKINENKSAHITFTLRRDSCPAVTLNGIPVPQYNEVKYLGMHIDRRLTWKTHIWTKRKQLGLKLKKLYWLIGRNSALTLDNKLLLYKSLIKPIWTYGIQLWGAASKSNINIIERFQSKVLRILVNAPWYVTNESIRKDLGFATAAEEIQRLSTSYKKRLQIHPNPLAAQLHKVSFSNSRFKKYRYL
ncbi:hypothetical protein TKK_0009427 [Trichogramma kaykai]